MIWPTLRQMCSAVVILCLLAILGQVECRRAHKRFIIHVPLKMKSHHHTHTVYKNVHHPGGKVEYKVLGYSHGEEHHGHGHGHGHSSGMHSDRGIVFNHYARHAENNEHEHEHDHDHDHNEYNSEDYGSWD